MVLIILNSIMIIGGVVVVCMAIFVIHNRSKLKKRNVIFRREALAAHTTATAMACVRLCRVCDYKSPEAIGMCDKSSNGYCNLIVCPIVGAGEA